jgi:hypothetical protein
VPAVFKQNVLVVVSAARGRSECFVGCVGRDAADADAIDADNIVTASTPARSIALDFISVYILSRGPGGI